jgi:hypothetical protein
MISLIAAFQQKLLLPTFGLALGIGIAGYFMAPSIPIIQGTGYGYIFAGPVMHYFIYELRYENEYYFYFNSGLSKIHLYTSTIILNVTLSGLILFYG